MVIVGVSADAIAIGSDGVTGVGGWPQCAAEDVP